MAVECPVCDEEVRKDRKSWWVRQFVKKLLVILAAWLIGSGILIAFGFVWPARFWAGAVGVVGFKHLRSLWMEPEALVRSRAEHLLHRSQE